MSEAPTDPVCGMSLDTASLFNATFADREYFFCSAECREQFVASPEEYADHMQEG